MTYDPTNAKLSATCETPGILYGVCFDAEHNRLFGAGADRAIYQVDLNAEELAAQRKWAIHDNYISAVTLVGDHVVSAAYDQRLIWTDAESGECVRSVAAHRGWVRDLILFPDGTRLASVGDDMLVKIWDCETGVLQLELDGHKKQTPQGYATALYAVAITPDGKHIASGDRIGAVCIWESDTGKLVQQVQAPTFYTYDPQKRVRSIGGIRALRFSPNGLTLAIAGIGEVTNVDGFVGPCRVELWDWQSGKRTLQCQDKHKAVFNHIAFHPTQSYLIAAGGGGSGGILAFWDMKQEPFAHKAKPKGHIQQFVLDPGGQRLFAVGYGGFQIWDLGH